MLTKSCCYTNALILLVVIPADTLCSPGLVVVVNSTLLFGIANNICHGLQIPSLRLQPLVNEQLWILANLYFIEKPIKPYSNISI